MNEMNTGASQRPTLLTVICILSFIAGVWGLWGGIQSAFTDAPQREFEEDSAMVMAEKSVEKAVPMGYTNIALSLLSLVGVWLMWNLKKNGFWIYVVAAVGGLVVPMVFLGGGLLTALGVGFMGLISVVFIILYAVNLKHMH
jgi:hypothetical protein